MLRFPSQFAALAAASILGVAVAGCSGTHSLLPNAGGSSTTANGVRSDRGSRFQPIKNSPPTGMQMAFLMTDGSILTQSYASYSWYRYVPDASGNYADGTWSQVGSLPSGYAPSAFASAVMNDGRFVIIGGEYNYPGNYDLQLVNLGAVYDPIAQTWKKLGHPKGWKFIGDSPSSVLSDGRYLLGQKLTERDAALNPKTLRWTSLPHVGKADFNSEEGWTLLPNGTILTEDVKNAPNSEIYNPSTGTWTTAGSTIVDLHSPSPYHNCLQYGPRPKDCYLPPGEIGPAVLRPDGTVFATGSGSGPSGGGAGHTAVYTVASGTWAKGPDFPSGDNAGDSFGVLEPSGNVLAFGVSGRMYEFNGSTFTQVGNWAGPPILLPTGQVMMLGYSQVVLYNPTGGPQASWAPAIKNAPKSVQRGKTYKISGTQFNGLSQAMSFGDEYQNATNYPLVRITNKASGNVFYARTHNISSMGVATGSLIVSTDFDVPSSAQRGKSTIVVVANGIPSQPVNLTVK